MVEMIEKDEKTQQPVTTVLLPADKNAEQRDENGMTSEEIFDQLEDESRVVTSGRGSILPPSDNSNGISVTGYSAGTASGNGSGDSGHSDD